MSNGLPHYTQISGYNTEGRFPIDLRENEGPGWVFSVARNEWEKFDKLVDNPNTEDDYLVGKGFTVYYPKKVPQQGATVIIRK